MRLASIVPLAVAALLLAACGGEDEHVPRDAAAADAAPDAGGPDAGPDAELGVRCGPEMVRCDPASTQGCCTDPPDEPRCEPSGGLCLGQLVSCDGREDCEAGDVCCDYGFGAGCGAADDCVEEQGGTVICHDDRDCTAATPRCCGGTCAAACATP